MFCLVGVMCRLTLAKVFDLYTKKGKGHYTMAVNFVCLSDFLDILCTAVPKFFDKYCSLMINHMAKSGGDKDHWRGLTVEVAQNIKTTCIQHIQRRLDWCCKDAPSKKSTSHGLFLKLDTDKTGEICQAEFCAHVCDVFKQMLRKSLKLDELLPHIEDDSDDDHFFSDSD